MVLDVTVTAELVLRDVAARLPGGGDIPNPRAKPPPGVEAPATDWLAYFDWIAMITGVFALVFCGILMMIGRRNRSTLADGAAGIPWVIGGLLVVSLASGIVTAVL